MAILIPKSDMWVQSVMPQGQLGYQDIRVNPDEFGARVGQVAERLGVTMEQAANMMAQNAVARQQMINETNVNDVYANQFDPAARKKYQDFLQLRGKDAEASFADFQQQIKDLASDARASLPNAPQQKLFDEISRRRISADLDLMARHAAAQTAAWHKETANAISDLYGRRIVDTRYDSGKVAGLVQSISTFHRAQNELMGQDKAETDRNAAAAIDKGLSDAVLTEAQTNPTGAKVLYDRYESYMSSDAVRQHVLSHLLPAVRQEQNKSVYKDVLNRFNLTSPDSDISDIGAATSWVTDPNNYKDQLADPDRRNDMAKTIQGAWNRARQFHNDNQSQADSSFMDAVAKREIAGLHLQTWRDPNTGLPASGDIVQAAIEHGANPVRPSVSDKDTLLSLADDISNRRMTDQKPLYLAYLGNLITDRDFRDMTSLYDTFRDPAKSRWFDSAKRAFYSRYADPDGPNEVNPDAITLFPRYLADLDQAIRDQDLKGTQIRDTADKMLQNIDRDLVGQWIGNPSSVFHFANYYGGPPVSRNNPVVQQNATPATQASQQPLQTDTHE